MANSAYLLNTNALLQPANQTAHGFSVGEVIVWDSSSGGEWIYASADAIGNCDGAVMVAYLNGANSFWFSQVGKISNITPQTFTNATLYYLSPTNPGQLTSTKPTAAGQVVFPCFLATGTDEGLYFGGTGVPVQSDTESTFVITANQTLASNSRYIVNGGAQLLLPLPTGPAVGDTIIIDTINANGYLITFVGGQTVITAAGTFATSITSSTVGDSISMVCRTAGAASVWVVENLNTGSIAFA